MTIQMNIAEAKAKLSELVARAEAGEEVIIARDGHPVATLEPRVRPRSAERRLGVWDRYGVDIPADIFLAPDPEVETALEIWERASLTPKA